MSRKMKSQSIGDHLGDNQIEDKHEIQVLRKRLAEHELLHNKIKTEFDALKQSSDDSKAKAFMYYQMLTEEKKERKRTEEEALNVLKDVKHKYENKRKLIDKLKGDYEKRIEDILLELKEAKDQLDFDRNEAQLHAKCEHKTDGTHKLNKDWDQNEAQLHAKCEQRTDGSYEPNEDWGQNETQLDAKCEQKTDGFHEPNEDWDQNETQLDSNWEQKTDSFHKPNEDWDQSETQLDTNWEQKTYSFHKPNEDWNQSEAQLDAKCEQKIDGFHKPNEDWDQNETQSDTKCKQKTDGLHEPNEDWDQNETQLDTKCKQKTDGFHKPNEDWDQNETQLDTKCKQKTDGFHKPNEDWDQNETQLDTKCKQKTDGFHKPNEDTHEIERLKEMLAQLKEDATIARIDLRVAKRELEQSRDLVKYLRENSKDLSLKLNELKKCNESEIEVNKCKDQQIEELKAQIEKLELEIKSSQSKNELNKVVMEDKIKALQIDSKALRELQNNESVWRGKYDELSKRNEQLLNDNQLLDNKLKDLQIKFNSKINECQQKDIAIEKLTNKNAVLRKACTEIETQAEQFRNKYEGLGQQKQKLLVDKNDTITEVQRLNKELQNIKNELMSELKEKEEVYKRLESQQIQYQNEIQTEKLKLLNVKQELEKECQKSREYEERIATQERSHYSSDSTISSLSAKVNYLEEHLIAIKEEAAQHITTIANLKDSNQRLTIAFEDSMGKIESFQDRIEQLYNQLDTKEEELNHERIATQETLNQQLKLIDFLQDKVESLERQKKPLFSITPTKKLVNSQRLCPQEFKHLDKALAEEKTKNRRLTEQLYKIKVDANCYKNEVFHLKKSIKTEELNLKSEPLDRHFNFINNKNHVINENHEKPADALTQIAFENSTTSFQRMHHNIPHRFTEVIIKSNTKCVSCAQTIHFGRKAIKCSECSTTSHPKCVEILPNNCGLPPELMQHLFQGSNDVNVNYFDAMLNNEEHNFEEVQNFEEVPELEPSAPVADSPINDCDSSDSSATTDNNESDRGAFLSQALESTAVNSQIREIEAICENKEEGFSFTDSMIEILENDQKS